MAPIIRFLTASLLAGASMMSAAPLSAQAPTCRAPAAGSLPKPAKVPKKDRGKFSVEAAPRLSTLVAQAICDSEAKMVADRNTMPQGAALGISNQVLNTAAGRLELMALPGVESELQKALAAFARSWPYAQLPRQPRILFRASDSYDAYALPDNTIVMSTGILQAADSDSEVLFVLAHEYAHLLLGHHLSPTVNSGGNAQLLGAVSTVYVAGSLVSQLRSSRGSLSAMDVNRVDDATRRAATLTESLRFALDDIFTPSWSHEQEDEADAVALDLLIRSNSSIDSYANVFARLQKMMDQQTASRAKGKATAESSQKALEASLKQIGSLQLLGAVTSGSTRGLAWMGGKLALGLGASALSNSANAIPKDTHLPPEERRKGLAAYFQAGYPTADPPIDTGAMVKRYKALPDYKRAIALKDTYLKARQAYFSMDFTGAITLLKGIGAGTKTAPTFVNFMAALAARDMGNSTQAKLYYEAARTGTGVPNVQVFESYAEARIADRDFAGSQIVLNDALNRFRDADHFRSIAIERSVAEGNDALASSDYSSCQQVKGRDYIPARCKAAYPQAAAAETTKKPRIRIPGLPF
ncbi:M48 family metalloprotease [Aquisediminimonas profunda]|uniref:M48 family metalloprotease n=1 Tax=Aquisediminimonas profunda TaxID=1550733 RepID=UPI001C639BC9|nr:M48 family metalloprotease [Aquisediminimonas profunda]